MDTDGYVRNGREFIVCTVPRAAKVAALRHDPHVALTIDTDEFPPKVLRVRGTAELAVIDGIPDEYLQVNRKNTTPEQ